MVSLIFRLLQERNKKSLSPKHLMSSSFSSTNSSSSSGDSSPLLLSSINTSQEEISAISRNDKDKVGDGGEMGKEEDNMKSVPTSGMSTRARSTPTIPPNPTAKGENKNEPTKKVKKKTVTFKTVLETSDDVIEKKVYNPDGAPLVPIIKKESLVRNESIVKPSRLTEILKKNYNNLNLSKVKTMAFGSQETDSKGEEQEEEENDEEEERLNGENSDDGEPTKKTGSVSMGDKRFILPKRSLHSRRVIKPNKKFLDDMDGCSAKAIKRVNSGNKNNGNKLATVKGEDEGQVVAESDTKSKAKAVALQENATGKNRVTSSSEVVNGTETGNPDGKGDGGGDAHKLPCSNLFGQPINMAGNELNLTPFGSNKVILRQPRLQFAIPQASFAKTFSFGSSESIKGNGSTSSVAAAATVGPKSNSTPENNSSSIMSSALNLNSGKV